MSRLGSGDPSLRITLPEELDRSIRDAVGYFWSTRRGQQEQQGSAGDRDRGSRAAVTGGAQMDGFVHLLEHLLLTNGVPPSAIFLKRSLELPGFFRPTKRWDLLVIHQGHLLVVAELKSQVGPSFSNNANNRAEEAIGSAKDIWTAYRENAFGPSRKPWLGYLFLLEDHPASQASVRTAEPHFAVFPEFRDASYAVRYQELLRRLVREQLYTEAAFLMSHRDDFAGDTLTQPASDLAILPFLQSLLFSVQVNLSALPNP